MPRCSVIVPVYNDPDGLRDTLESLIDQTAPNLDYEIIAVNNKSTDSTKAVANWYAHNHKHIQAIEQTDIQGSYATRNRGIEAAEGDILCFLDANETVKKDFITSVIEYMDTSDADYVGLNVRVKAQSNSIWGQYDAAAGLPVKHYLDTKNFAPTCGVVTTREVIKTVGTFNPQLVSGGDKDFGQRVARAGFEQAFAPDIYVYHPARETFREHLSKAIRIGRGQFQQLMLDLAPPDDTSTTKSAIQKITPPAPNRVKNRMQIDAPFGRIYAIEYGLKLAQNIGILAEFKDSIIQR